MTHEMFKDEQEFFTVLQEIERNTYYFSESRKQRLQTLELYADRLGKVWQQQDQVLASRGRKMLNYCYSIVPVGDRVYHLNKAYQLILIPFTLSGIRVDPHICVGYFDDHAVRDIMPGGSTAGEILDAMRQNMLFYAELFFPKAMDMMHFPYELSKEEACRSTRCLQDIFRYIGEDSVYAGEYRRQENGIAGVQELLYSEPAIGSPKKSDQEPSAAQKGSGKTIVEHSGGLENSAVDPGRRQQEVRHKKTVLQRPEEMSGKDEDSKKLSCQHAALLRSLQVFQEKEHGSLSVRLEEICLRYESLLRYTEAHPEQQSMLKKTESYYLPTLLKLLQDTERDFEDDRELLQKTADSVAKALKRLEKDIRQPERMRRQAESETLIWMMKQDGVLDGEIRLK